MDEFVLMLRWLNGCPDLWYKANITNFSSVSSKKIFPLFDHVEQQIECFPRPFLILFLLVWHKHKTVCHSSRCSSGWICCGNITGASQSGLKCVGICACVCVCRALTYTLTYLRLIPPPSFLKRRRESPCLILPLMLWLGHLLLLNKSSPPTCRPANLSLPSPINQMLS